jgi:ribA/ribD-fused uncharacterized protein
MESLKSFFKGRTTKPKRYVFSQSGDLVIKGDKGVVLETIELPPYRAPTLSERAEQEATHTRDLRAAEKTFEAAKADLRSQDWEHWDTHSADIRMSMLAVERADQALQQIRFPLMAMQTFKSLRTNLVDFSKPKDAHMLKDVHIVITRPRTLEEEYVRTAPLPKGIEAAGATVAGATGAGVGAPKAPVVLIDSTSELSGWAHHDVVVNGVTYPTSYHALMAEVAASFGNEALAETVRATEAPADVSVTLDVLTAFGATEESWNAKRSELLPPILEEQFKANPGAAEALLQTGMASLGYVPPDDSTDMLMGIGLDATNPAARDSTKWTGQNLYGKILEKVRADLVIQRRTMVAQTPVFVLASPVESKRTLRIANVAKQPTVASGAATVASVASDAASSVVSAAKPVANAIASTASSVASTASSAASSVASTASSAATSVASTASTVASTVADAAKPAINAVRSLFP